MCKADSRTLSATERRAQAVELRIEGYTYKKIGEQLGMSESAAYKTIKKALSQAAERIKKDSDELVAMELLKLEEIHAAIWPQVLSGDLKAIDRLHRNMDRYSRLLGLNAPTKIAATNRDGDENATQGVIVVPAVANSVDEWLAEYSEPPKQ